MSLSEKCSCGATIDFVPGLEIATAARLARDWRKSHRHDSVAQEEPEKPPLGFNTHAVSANTNDGEGEAEWEGMFAEPGARSD